MTDIGTFDLTDLCGCGSDCADCCGQTCGACTGVPNTLHATVTSTGANCACASGQTVTFTWDGVSTWTSSVMDLTSPCASPPADPGQSITFTLYCSGGVFKIDFATTGCAAGATGLIMSSTTCSPFQLVTQSINIKNCCSDTAGGQTIVFTITA